MDAALDSGVRRSPRRVFRSVSAGGPRRLVAGLAVAGVVLIGMLGGTDAARADSTPAPTPADAPATAPATSTAAPTDAPTDGGGVTVALAPDAAGVLQPGQDLAMTISVTNTTASALPAGTVRAWLDRAELGTRAALDTWLTPSTGATPAADSLAVDIPTAAVAPGTTGTFRAALPAAGLGLSGFGAYGLEARYTASTTLVDSRSTIVWSVDAPTREASVAVIMPLTVPAGSRGLLTPAELETYTASGGVLELKLDSVIGRQVTLAIDPMVIVSIRVLGTAAPQSALDWLARLASAPNPTFPLAYGDADISVERQAGAAAMLEPTSFDYALSASNFQSTPSPDPFGRETSSAGAGAGAAAGGAGAAGTTSDAAGAPSSGTTDPTTAATTAPTPDPIPASPPGTLPSFAELTSWNYTRTDLAWPAAGTVTTDDLDFFAAGGRPTSILSSTNVALPSSVDGLTPSAPATIGDKRAVIVDAGLSDALQNASTATTGTARDAALAELSGILAVVDAQTGDTPTALVADLGRPAPAAAAQIDSALDALDTLPWSTARSLAEVLTAAPLGVSVQNSDEPASRKATVSAMLAYEKQVDDFSSVAAKPELLTGNQRATLLAVLAQSWAADPDGRTAAEADYATLTSTTLDSVKIIDGSNINLFATSSEVPVLISNELNQPVTVDLQVTPSNGRLVVEPGRIEVVVEAKSQKTARVPVKAAVASGQVDLRLDLYSPSGVTISQAAPRQINVSADWEGIGTIVIGVLAVGLLAFGIVRQVQKRRRAKAAAAAGEPSEAAPDAAADAGAGTVATPAAADPGAHPTAGEDRG
ncbi:hypothetical protein C5B96_11820 [Subtercola sp. Z020]|uniref:DUF6049 family protein n=1 Tax=Subtercola sp. Z020 TaxID=2080582 RepID=UPI000CE7FFB5|nr:DUF6049 family protein [Subtercola sp. Z020]PPF79713.1 hypothetical protein C5B96_11820 [Subtercola sp. Z020]